MLGVNVSECMSQNESVLIQVHSPANPSCTRRVRAVLTPQCTAIGVCKLCAGLGSFAHGSQGALRDRWRL